MKGDTRVGHILRGIRTHGMLTSRDIAERYGLAQKSQESRLRAHLAAGTIEQIKVQTVGRSPRLINAYRWVGLAEKRSPTDPASPGKRICLGCGNTFASRGAGNRICARCKKSSNWTDAGSAFDMPAQIRYH